MVNQQVDTTVFAALGDPRRALIVDLLAQRDRTVSELAAQLPISLPGTLKHLAVLESAGLVSRTKAGRTVTVHLQRAPLQSAEDWLHRTRTFWAAQLGNLANSFAPEPSPTPPKETP
ncbi:ArsR/SmtB family transcription factor [Ornithinimicrobium faecis]|uniref:Metalloregulator ArsR/SmtB family transcription factor n=1 Tax=Ornithinimicrobium faecis TaxID=2934158 RepID=A0ABY4YVB6_9MICO|nr:MULTISPECIES: metalloregulator ArsR/SmtB family transcription factor [unclassified Ornithinimicrobium]USQ80677.1 metalloregulator ArsR/SmtB family transcription factor [Ornithinimicrobium sp. HY1793]